MMFSHLLTDNSVDTVATWTPHFRNPGFRIPNPEYGKVDKHVKRLDTVPTTADTMPSLFTQSVKALSGPHS